MSDAVYWMVEFEINPGAEERFQALMDEMSSATEENEPGTLNYEWYIGDNGTTCHLFERYADSEAALVHLAAFGEKFAARLMAEVEQTRLVAYGDMSADVRQILANVGGTFMDRVAGFAR